MNLKLPPFGNWAHLKRFQANLSALQYNGGFRGKFPPKYSTACSFLESRALKHLNITIRFLYEVYFFFNFCHNDYDFTSKFR